MSLRTILRWLFLLALLPLLGCSGSNEPVNKDRDMPVPPKAVQPKKDKNN